MVAMVPEPKADVATIKQCVKWFCAEVAMLHGPYETEVSLRSTHSRHSMHSTATMDGTEFWYMLTGKA